MARRTEARPQQLPPEESHAANLLEQAGVPLLDDREAELLNSVVQEPLGAGCFGSCRRTRGRQCGEELVIKTYHARSVESLVAEASVLQRLQGVAGVQRLIGVCVRRNQLVTRYAGLTADRYFSTIPALPDLLSVLLQVARTLQGLAGEGYAHNDVRCDNVCVREGPGGPEVTVIDLGNARATAGIDSGTDTHDLAQIIHGALALHGGLGNAPRLSPVRAWADALTSQGSSACPGLEALILELEALLGGLRGRQTQGGGTGTPPPGGGDLRQQEGADTPSFSCWRSY